MDKSYIKRVRHLTHISTRYHWNQLVNWFRHRSREDYIVREADIVILAVRLYIVALFSSPMTPLDSEILQRLGVGYFGSIEQASIFIFFYGASSSLAI